VQGNTGATRDGPGRFFASHPALYRVSVAAAAGTAGYAGVRSVRAAGARRLPWIALAVLEAGIAAGMVHAARAVGR
jgi:hypothetical protein